VEAQGADARPERAEDLGPRQKHEIYRGAEKVIQERKARYPQDEASREVSEEEIDK